MTRWLTACLLLVLAGEALGGVRAGVGYSTVTSGRTIPALSLGVDFGRDWAGSAMLSGAQTEAYYTSGFMVNGLRTKDWGEFWFGRLEVGFGGGVFYGEKGIYTSVGEDGRLTDLEKSTDQTLGPAFRVAFKPFAHAYLSVEYLMGIGTSILSNAWQDVGMGSIGIEL